MKRLATCLAVLLVLLWAAQAHATALPVQAPAGCNANTLGCAFGSNVTAGHTLIVAEDVKGTFSTISDTVGSTFHLPGALCA